MSNDKYYFGLVLDLMVSVPEFREFCRNSCPTYWLDGTKCSEIDDAYNKASLEIDFLEQDGLI